MGGTIANHGLMHMAITNAEAGDPYEIDTMIFSMANMAWNSTMNTSKIRIVMFKKRIKEQNPICSL